MIKFDELDSLLHDARAGSRAAECHGFLCGYLCVSDNIESSLFRKFLLSEQEDEALLIDCTEQIAALAEDVHLQMSSDSFDLQLLLPDDHCSLIRRSVALTEWCQGFLSGLGIGGIIDFDSISDESRELLDDMYKICCLDTRFDEVDEDGEGESALMELIEYVRMGALFIHEEFHSRTDAPNRPGVLH